MVANRDSAQLCRQLRDRIESIPLEVPHRPQRYEDGDVLDLSLTMAWPQAHGRGRFRIERYVGGGFAGQVYRCVLESLEMDEVSTACGLAVGGRYAVKILVPAGKSTANFRSFIYWLAFQGAFGPRVNEAACRTGLLWPKILRVAGRERFGRDDAIADTHASFYDQRLRAYGEVREWVEGRTWRLEADGNLRKRRPWRTVDPHDTESPEYIAKRQFMAGFVAMLRDMGAAELARQYQWATMKSQPNALKRYSAGSDPSAGLCAVDLRAGLALVPLLPMSPGDIFLILDGLRRGSLTQFDRCDWRKLHAYVDARHDVFAGYEDMLADLECHDRAYRRSMPDVWHQGWRLMIDRELRVDVCKGLVAGYRSEGLVDDAFSAKLEQGGIRFTCFYVLGAVPVLGKVTRRLWGDGAFRRHLGRFCRSWDYVRKCGKRSAASAALEWYRAGRVGETHARRIADHVWLYWLERLTIGLMPLRRLHRFITEPLWWLGGIANGCRYLRRFLKDAGFREQWLREQVEEGYREGMLHEEERDAILAKIKDPFIAKYLKSVGVHLLTLPVTQIVSVIVGGIAAGWVLSSGGTWEGASAAFVGIIFLFQFIPISPGSICRGLYVVYLMARERDFRNYMVAAPVSFLKYLGYLAFPIQMATTHPALSQFMAGRWATQAVHMIPVFGEQGALLEHMIFDLFFNYSQVLGRWVGRHIKGLLDIWLLLGTILAAHVFFVRGIDWSELADVKTGVNVMLAYIVVFLFPRVLFLPLRRRHRE